MKTGMNLETKKQKICGREIFLTAVLLLYPLRHIWWGLDLWDTGYNYANFQFMGTQHMDSMWLFSTYLATAAGHFLTKLPFGNCLLGMNFYTGLFVSLLAITGFLICTRILKMSSVIVFLGEFAATSLCWCPTALLYNYLTYVLLLYGVIFLYLGLEKEQKRYLAAAGVCLGSNVMVRFSNLPQAALILAVWGYAFITRKQEKGHALKKTVIQTLICMLGYFVSLALWIGLLSAKYGFAEYMEGIRRLFGMTENATDYTAYAMILKMLQEYVQNLYWVVRFCVPAVLGIMGFAILPERFTRWKKAGYLLVLCLFAVWLYKGPFATLEFASYAAMFRPGIVFLILTLGICLVQILHPATSQQEKLLAGVLLIMIPVTSLGSNNGTLPSLNNLFLAAPYTLEKIWCFLKKTPEKKKIRKVTLFSFPVKATVCLFLLIFLVQSIGFGTSFVFAEAQGAPKADTEITGNPVLKGMRSEREKAAWIEEISAYVQKENLEGKEILIYGNLPAMSYYLNMPSAFNPWIDLKSYSLETMEKDMVQMENAILNEEKEAPVVLLERKAADYVIGLYGFGDSKLNRIMDFMERFGYQMTFENEKFTLWQAAEQE